ncbi:FlaD/FlaE family flagellar protein [Haladaptatus sp. NG-SE-30]
MKIDPINYDVDELHELFDREGEVGQLESQVKEDVVLWPSKAQYPALSIEDPTPEQHKWLCKLLEGVNPSMLGSKPYLHEFPKDKEASALTFDWLHFLSETAGFWGTVDTLILYQTLGWFTPQVAKDLHDHLFGIAMSNGDGYKALDTADHLLSFAYVAKLAALV